jgi:hypothetical protein
MGVVFRTSAVWPPADGRGAGAVAALTVIPVAAVKGAASAMTRRNIGPGEMLKTPVFLMLSIRMVLVALGGLMAVSVTASSDSC